MGLAGASRRSPPGSSSPQRRWWWRVRSASEIAHDRTTKVRSTARPGLLRSTPRARSRPVTVLGDLIGGCAFDLPNRLMSEPSTGKFFLREPRTERTTMIPESVSSHVVAQCRAEARVNTALRTTRRRREISKWIAEHASAWPLGYDTIDFLRGDRYYTAANLHEIVQWSFEGRDGRRGELHLQGVLSRTRRNTPAQVRTATRLAFYADDDEDALGALRLLTGVGEYIASSVLTVNRPDRFLRILHGSWRALEGWDLVGDHFTPHWGEFVLASRLLATTLGFDLRSLDRAFMAIAGRAGI